MTEKNETIDSMAFAEQLTLSNNFMFSRVMRDPALCKEMLQRILGVKIRKIKYIESEKHIKETADAKGIRLDIFIEDAENTVYDVECQTIDTHELPKRSRYYQSQIDMAVLDSGKHYSNLNKSFIIFICTFDLFGKGRHRYTFRRKCIEEPSLELEDESDVIFLNADSDANDCSSELRAFLDYIAGRKTDKDEYLEDIDNAVTDANRDRIWRKEIMTLEMEYMTRELLGERRGEERGEARGIGLGRMQALLQMCENGGTDDDLRRFLSASDEEIAKVHEMLVKGVNEPLSVYNSGKKVDVI